MMNFIAKSLVLVQTILSLAGMTWAITLVVQSRDLGWKEPAREVLEYGSDGNPATKPGAVIRYASEYDKSVVAVQEAGKSRDRAYQHVKPALDSIDATKMYLYENHRHYETELAHLRNERNEEDKKADKPFKVKRLKDAGNAPQGILGVPETEIDEVGMIKKPYKEYEGDLAALFKEVAEYEDKIKEKSKKTKDLTRELTGTDDANNYVEPGLYKLVDMEFNALKQIKVEIDDIKQDWSSAIRSAGSHRLRRSSLEADLEKLKNPPAPPKKNKKL